MFYSFLSYARTDADRYFERFVRDFKEELRGRIGVPTSDDLVFRDSNNVPLGSAWRPELQRALLVCRTFIAMLSPTYVRRPECSKEWAGFEWRMQTSSSATPAELLLPLMWIPIPDADMPPAIENRQLAHASLGSTYARLGLRCVVQNAGAEYRTLLTTLAELVRDLVRQHVLWSPSVLMPPGQLPDPFAMAKLSPASTSASTTSFAGGPRHVEFIVVAACQVELRASRALVTAYGAAFDEWCPYLPVHPGRVGLLVQTIALQEQLTAGLLPAAQNIVAHLRGACARNMLVVLVVDVWSLQLHSYRSWMNLFDRERFPNAGVLVVWNRDDSETFSRRNELADALRAAFPNLIAMKEPTFHEPDCVEELCKKLHEILSMLRQRVTEFGEVMRKAEGFAVISKPLLHGPGGA